MRDVDGLEVGCGRAMLPEVELILLLPMNFRVVQTQIPVGAVKLAEPEEISKPICQSFDLISQ